MRSAGAMGAACSSTWSESRESTRRRSCSSKSGPRTGWGGASIPAMASSRSAFGADTIRRIAAARTRWFSRSICDSIHECAERALPGRDGARSRVEAARAEAGPRTGDSCSGKKIRGKPLGRAAGFETAATASSPASPSSRSGARGGCQARSCRRPRGAHPAHGLAAVENRRGGLRGLRLAQDLHSNGVRRRRRAARLAAGGRGTGCRGGRARRTFRGAGRPPARQHACRDRPRARRERLHLQRAQVPSAGQPQSGALRGRPVHAPSAAPARAHPAETDPRDGALCRAGAAQHRGEHCEPARAPASLSGRAAHRDLSPGLSAAQSSRQGQGLGRPVLRPAQHRGLVIALGGLHLTGTIIREESMRKLLAAVIVLITAGLAGCGYNDIQRNDEQVKSAWSEVLNQYQRRADLIPNLVNTVKGFAAQEQQVLTQVTEARSRVGSIQATPELLNDEAAFRRFQQAQAGMTSALSRLLAVAENYPQLKSDANFRDLQAQLEGTENRIAVARNRYIKAVQEYNVLIRQFPVNLTAMLFGYQIKPSFSVEDEKAISKPPTVDFGKPGAPAKR